jgi:hypothetical protein
LYPLEIENPRISSLKVVSMPDKDDAREASEAFYLALNQMLGGDASALPGIWVHSQEATTMHLSVEDRLDGATLWLPSNAWHGQVSEAMCK